MKKLLQKNKFIISLFLFSFIIRLIVIILVKTPLVSDFKTMYDAAIDLLNGKNSYLHTTYFITWGYQMGHVIYEILLLKIWNDVFFLKLINILITSLIVVLIYLISKKIFSEKAAKIIAIVYSIFPFPLFLNTVLTNQHLPLLLVLVVIYLLISMDFKNKLILKSLIIGFLLGLSNILRSEGIIYIFGIFIYFLYLVMKKVDIKKLVISFSFILISYLLIFNLASFLLIKTNLSVNGLKNMNPTWKFILGFNFDTNGLYSSEDALKYSSYERVPEAKEEFKNRVISNYSEIPILFAKKAKIQWLNSDLSWSLGYMSNNTIYKVFNIINQVFIIVIDCLVLFSLIKFLDFKNISKGQVLITIILLLYFGVYLLIEIMPRYAYAPQVLMIILSGVFIDQVTEKKNKLM